MPETQYTIDWARLEGEDTETILQIIIALLKLSEFRFSDTSVIPEDLHVYLTEWHEQE